jgi:hypothetical protein
MAAARTFDQLLDFRQREAEPTPAEDERDTIAVAAAVEAERATASGCNQTLGFIEAQRPRRNAEFARDFPNGHRPIGFRHGQSLALQGRVARRPDNCSLRHEGLVDRNSRAEARLAHGRSV